MYRFYILVLITLITYSCETTDPGCLDLNAENYDVFAVSECDSCCVYPSVRLNTMFIYDTIAPMFFSTLYPYADEDSIRIDDIELSFSEFNFLSSGDSYKILDSIRGEVPKIYDDFLVIKKASRNIAIGQTDYVLKVDSVHFYVGMDKTKALGFMPYESVDVSSNFISVIEDMYVDSTSTLIQARVDLWIQDSVRALTVIDIEAQEIGFNLDVQLEPGIPWEIPISIDMKKMIEGISAQDSNEEMSEILGQNISASISKR